MTSASGDPIPSINEATLTDIATNGAWAVGGLTPSPAALDVSGALLAAVQDSAGSVDLPAELADLVAAVRQRATIGLPRIAASDGVHLSALSIKLNDGGEHPVVIVPAGWNPYGWLPFLFAYLSLAQRGYHVLAYTPRGLGTPGLLSTSEGFIDVAGPQDWADGQSVIDHAQAEFAPSAVGFLGESYGSGISQLVAAHDPGNRVAAVVALSTWGNLATSLYANGTRHVEAVKALIAFTGGSLEEKFDAESQQILRDFLDGRNLGDVVAWGTERSPETYADITNSRGIPTFLSNTWHESLFPAGQTIDSFAKLDVPKHLNMWIGDHGAPEGPGLSGLLGGVPFPGLRDPLQEVYAWLDHHLLGAANDVPGWAAVNNQVMFTYQTKTLPDGTHRITSPARREPRPSWEDVTTGAENWHLTGTGGNGDGSLTERPTAGWTRSFTAGSLTAATAADDKLMQTGQKEWFGNPKTYDLAKFERPQLLVWSTDPLDGGRRIRGTATVRLTLRSTADAATLVAYLFDVAPDGTAQIITHEPYTATGLTAQSDVAVNWLLQPAAYDLPDGNRLALVVNSRDRLYAFTGTDGSTTTLSSSEGNEAVLEIPLG
ncbi:CocE/NonD family hydrolase [Streptomyces sp. RKAG290]|uniref:CocE/NonD family hydrolase n=1 Tax=Streptomyces sp. RKAG290 TaxID=2888348 RepID=UPI0020337A6F|nr:CocE/NonD family hydrolase [Streptomyces sp. RKAG290]MCM2412593.1 hypothetical protein [Streptomyces sp. RKAG290]